MDSVTWSYHSSPGFIVPLGQITVSGYLSLLPCGCVCLPHS